MSIWEQIRILNEWAPLITFGRRYMADADVQTRALVVGEAAEWLASKTQTKLDDQIVGHFVAILKTPEGEGLVRFLVAQADVFVSAVDAAAAAEGQS